MSVKYTGTHLFKLCKDTIILLEPAESSILTIWFPHSNPLFLLEYGYNKEIKTSS
jgi:hypothetical protein